MKKTLFAGLLLFSHTAWSQTKNEVTIKVGYIPETVYTVSENTSVNMTMTYSGPDDFLDALREQGVENPTHVNNIAQKTMEFRTGKLTKKGNFPVELRFLSVGEDLKRILKEGTVVYGKGTPNAFPVFDSISGNYDKEFKKMFLQSLQSIMSQIKYPEQKMKIGESASIDTPLSLPIGPMALNMKITSTYKLLSIKGNEADFDVSMVYSLAGDMQGKDIKAGGNAKGKMLYLIDKSFYKDYTVDMNMNMEMNIDEGVNLYLLMKMVTKVSADIKANK